MRKAYLLFWIGLLSLVTCLLGLFFIFNTGDEAVGFCGNANRNAVIDFIEPEITDTNVLIGRKLFEANCTACHAVHKEVVGPSLRDIHLRRKKEWLYEMIQNSQTLVKSGDKEAVELFNRYNGQVMQSFSSLNHRDIDYILEFIKYESGKIPYLPNRY